jgi:hypothetical protein
MLQDVLGSLTAVLAFAVVLYAPGYVFAYAADLYGFRQMGFSERSVWATACSFCILPILGHIVGRIAGLDGLCWLLTAFLAGALLLLWRRRAASTSPPERRAETALVLGGWIVFVLLMLVDFQVGHKLYFSVVVADQSYRIAFTDAVVRTGVPPANPLYMASSPVPMPYYYFWYVLCAVVVKIAHVTARQSFIASSIWAGFGLLATLALFTQHFFRWERRKKWIAAGLLLVTGADLLPALGNALGQPSLNGDMEWWSVDPIDGWPDSLLWVPHHVASVLCCLLCFLILWRTLEPAHRSSRRWPLALAAFGFASAFGLSVYVACGFALLMAAWLLRLTVMRHPKCLALWRRVLVVSLLSTVLLTPFVIELASALHHTAINPANGNSAPAPHLFALSVRRMIDSGLLTGLPLFASLDQSHPVLLDQSLRLLLLLPGLAMELGVYAAVLVMLLLVKRRGKPDPPDDEARGAALFLTVAGLIMTMFLSSSVISNNDFGYRAVMLPQFFLLLLTADVLGSWWMQGSVPVISETRVRRRLVYGLLILGVAGTVYGAFILRAWLPIESHSSQSGFSQLPDDAFQVRTAFATLDSVAPNSAVVAFPLIDPTINRKDEVIMPNEFYQRLLVMDSGRQFLNAEWKCAVHFGGDPAACPLIRHATSQLYASPAPDAAWAEDFCNRFNVQYLALSHRDSIWNSQTGWPAMLPVIARQPGFMLLQCGQSRGK